MRSKRLTVIQRLIYRHLIYSKKNNPNEPCILPCGLNYTHRADRLNDFLRQVENMEELEYITVDRSSEDWREWVVDFGTNRTLLTEHARLHDMAA